MKNALGKLLFLFLGNCSLVASDFNYHINASSTDPYVKEAVILTIDINQTNHDIVLLFDFDIAKSKQYTSQRIDIKELDAYHNAQIRYTYLIYPLQSGTLSVRFNLTQKATTDESVAYSFSGDRDNVKTLETHNTSIPIKPLHLNVKPLPKGTQIVGDFTLEYTLEKHRAKVYEPLALQVKLAGIGYPPVLKSLFSKTHAFTYFFDAPMVTSVVAQNKTQTTVIYPMAFSHDKSFTLPQIAIKAFNPDLEKVYTLKVPAQTFEISSVEKKNLIDPIDSPKPFNIKGFEIETFLNYIIIFILGYLSAYIMQYKPQKKHNVPNPLKEKIKNAPHLKALLQILLAQKNHHLRPCIEKLESSLYNDSTLSLKQIKKEILEKIK